MGRRKGRRMGQTKPTLSQHGGGVPEHEMKKLIPLLLLTGCQPFVEYEHLSDPRIANDGYDLVCGGAQYKHTSVAVCQNFAPYGGQFVKVNAKYVWDD